MLISEIFFSIQGEGLFLGVPSAFVRTSGCPLRCEWCDSPYTSWQPEGESLSVAQVLARLAEYPAQHAVVTGGEPLIAAGVEELCSALRQQGYHITIETAGVVFKPIACDLASLSPKLASSTPHQRDGGRHAARHDALRFRPDVLRAFMGHCPYQLKFVIDRPEDLAEVLALLERLPPVDPTRVLLMPQGVTREELAERSGWLAELCKQHGFRFCPRLHIDLYGNTRGT
jgi:7-carboxy-7-deazaguanine synthase